MSGLALSADTVIERRESVVSADVANDAILLDIDSGYFFQLNRSAARIWALLEDKRTFGQLCDALRHEFGIGQEECEADVREFVAALQERGVVTVAQG